MDESVLWATENTSISLVDLCATDQLAHYADHQVTSIYCSTRKEFPHKESEVTGSQVPVDGKISELFFSDSDSDGIDVKIDSPEHGKIPLHEPFNMSNCSLASDSGYLDVKQFLPVQAFQLSSSSSGTHSDYFSHPEKTSGTLQCRSIVYCEESEDSLSLLGRPRCVVCRENPSNTCVMHHLTRHTDLCYSCAASCFARGVVCPLCSDRILYIYMYDDI